MNRQSANHVTARLVRHPHLRGLRFTAAAVAASLSAACLAATVTFPSTGRDIASAEDWGGTLPGTSDLLKFTTSATVTASNDVEFAGLFVGTEGKTIVLDMRDAVSGGSPRRIKMNGPAYIPAIAWYAKYTLCGGFWDFGNYAVGTSLDNNYSTANPGASATIDGGAVILCGSLVGQYGRGSNPTRVASLYVDGEGTVVTAVTMKVAQYNGRNNVFEIRNGAKVVLTGTGNKFLSLGGEAATDSDSNGNLLRVSSGASVERDAGTSNPFFYIGSAGSNNRLSVESGGTVKLAAQLYFGHADGASGNKRVSNRIEVTGANSLLSIGATYCGNASGVAASAGSSNNVASVTDGGTLSSGDRWYLYGHDNGIVVSNGTVTLANGGIMCQTSTNCFLRLQGAHPSFVSKTANSTSLYKHGFTIRFDLPEDGYDGSVAWPFVSENYANVDASVRIEIEGVERMAKRMRRQGIERETVNLAKFSNGTTGITAAMLARWNAALPRGAKLRYESNGLKLDVKAWKPTVMLLK